MGRDHLPEQSLLLLDGNSLINRAFYGLLGRQNLTAPDGTPTGAVFAFLNMYLRYAEDLHPTHVVAAFDRKEPTFRHACYDAYKGTRKPMPDELAVQLPMLKQLLKNLGVNCMEMAGFEADDLLGTLAAIGKKANMTVWVVSGDKDSFQLADDGITILQPITRSGRTETERYDSAAILERFQVTPKQFIDLKAIMGDPSDNIPGVKGIGEKGAIDLLKQYGSLDNIYASLDEIRPVLSEKLRVNKEMAYLSQRLATINQAVPITETIDHLTLKPADEDQLITQLTKLGFKNILNRLNFTAKVKPSDQTALHPTCSPGSLKQLAEQFAANPELPAVWLEKDQSVFWTVDSTHVFSLPAIEAASAWQIIRKASCRVVFSDYKRLLRSTGLPDLGGSIHDVVIAAYLLNQIEGRPDLTRLYQQATGQMLPDTDCDQMGVVVKKAAKLPVQTDLFDLAATVPQPCDNPLDDETAHQNHALFTGAIREIALHQKEQINQRKIEILTYEIEMPLAGILAAMENRGFTVDLQALDTLSHEMNDSLETLQAQIFEMCGRSFNLNSPRQLGEVLFVDLGLATGKKRSAGAFSTDSEELERLALEHPVIPLIIEYRQIAKLRSTFVEGLKKVRDPDDGRVHTTFNQTLTATGRLSSSEPNLQNIPIRMAAGQKIRQAFIASPGHILLDADYSQIELRLLAHLSGDKEMINAFVNNEDIHTNTAVHIFALPADKITADMRSIAKTMNFSIVYGISDFGLARDLGVSIRQAHQYIADYEAQYPEIRRYLNGLVESAYKNGYVETMTGRRRYMPELKSANRNLRQFGERAAMNTPVQGSAADMIKFAMVETAEQMKKAGLKASLILQVHDELIVEAPLAEAAAASAILKKAMENAMQLNVPLLAEVRQGASWADCK